MKENQHPNPNPEATQPPEQNPADNKLSETLSVNISLFKRLFQDDGTVRYRQFTIGGAPGVECVAIFIDGMVNNMVLIESLVKPLMLCKPKASGEALLEQINKEVLFNNETKMDDKLEEIVKSMVYGDTLLLIEGCAKCIILNSKGFMVRSVSEPENEKVLRGPREGFNEGILFNLALIRRRILTNDLKFVFQDVGLRTKTKVCLCYLESLVHKPLLKEVKRRLAAINIDGILDANYVEELIKDNRWSPFKTLGSTERPDIVASKLLEGRVAIVVDGTPIVLTAPYVLVENFHTNDDYYLNFYYGSIARLIRFLSFFITISLPALYLSLVAFHEEMIPTNLAVSILRSRTGMPFPLIVEFLGMLVVFEILRETGMRTPQGMGQALSIVGALVIGTAAVEARIVSAPVVIIIAFTGITGLMNKRLTGATIIMRTGLLVFSAVIGIYGYFFGLTMVALHIMSLRSFNIDYTAYIATLDMQTIKDSFTRSPWWKMRTRPRAMALDDVRGRNEHE